ncbi:MAG: VWA domain-containing protein [Deltaproteobacteria bacterium]|nr:VWA domain-containing protein [Deltaproteobacteria bacterium]
MRKLLVLLAVTRAAAAEPLGEYGDGVYLRTPAQITADPCEVALRFEGAIVDGWYREQLTNTTADSPMGAVEEVTLPAGAVVVGAKLDAQGSVAIPTGYSSEPASDAVGPDPLLVTSLFPDDAGHPRVRLIVAPFARSATVQVHFTAIATVRGGAMRLALPGWSCKRSVTVRPLAGATLAREHDSPTEAVAELAYGRPLVWTQAQVLGDGFTARATTTIAPVAKAPGAKRVLVLVDGSRSMELVGEPAIAQVLKALAAAVPKDAEVQGVIFDRTPGPVLAGMPALEAALHAHVPANGSDPVAAFQLAHNVLASARGEAMIVVISDGAFGSLGDDALSRALDEPESKVDVHAIVLDRGHLTAQSGEPLRLAIAHVGGSYVEVNADDLGGALVEIDSWLRPAVFIGDQPLLAGAGKTEIEIVRDGAKGASPAPIAELALTASNTAEPDPLDEKERPLLERRHPIAGDTFAFSVLATHGTVARARHDAVAGGGPFTRTVLTPDPPFAPEVRIGQAHVLGPSALDKQLLDTLLRLQLQPPAYVCYQKALGKNAKLGGLVGFHLEISRGEVTRATVDGLGDRDFDACLVDAAYRLVPPMPDPAYNTDDRSLVAYPLTFTMHTDKAVIVAGDADSESPLDIDAIKGGVARPPRHVDAGDTSQPLGGMHSTLQPPQP